MTLTKRRSGVDVRSEGKSGDKIKPWHLVLTAAVAFGAGLAWPKLLSGPDAGGEPPGADPGETPTTAAAGAEAPAPPASGPAPTESAPAEAPPAPAGAPKLRIRRGVILSCYSDSGERLDADDCGRVGLDDVVTPKLETLTSCEAAKGQNGKLALLVRPDFGRGTIRISLAKSTSVAAKKELLECAESALRKVNLSRVTHDQARYTMQYNIFFESEKASGGARSAPAPSDRKPPAHGEETSMPVPDKGGPADESHAQIVWDVALVRDKPRTGSVVGRLPQGTRVKLGAKESGWYEVFYGDGESEKGWLYRGALGR